MGFFTLGREEQDRLVSYSIRPDRAAPECVRSTRTSMRSPAKKPRRSRTPFSRRAYLRSMRRWAVYHAADWKLRWQYETSVTITSSAIIVRPGQPTPELVVGHIDGFVSVHDMSGKQTTAWCVGSAVQALVVLSGDASPSEPTRESASRLQWENTRVLYGAVTSMAGPFGRTETRWRRSARTASSTCWK